MLAEARADHLVFHHGDQAWLDLADQIRTRAEVTRAATEQS
ncbi:hypothetical protein [Glycomyces tenuis]|nr:hypothetical protein [Glycomyces tenuis]